VARKKKKKNDTLEFKAKNTDGTTNSSVADEISTDFDGNSADVETDVPELSEIEKANLKAQEYLDSLQRLKAEFDNYRKRSAKDRQKLAELQQSIVLEALLPTLDSFDAALPAADSSTDTDIYKGFMLIHAGLVSTLEKLGVQKMDLLNKPFNPETAEALMTQPSQDVEPDTIIGIIAAGYTFKEKVLRPARVVVSSAPEEPENDDV